jgi:4-hydroxy-3-methylbut-2-enyl diphosphate reductase
VQTVADVRPEWFEGAEVVGLTAGTSTPDDVIDRVEAQIRLCGDASVRLREDATARQALSGTTDTVTAGRR